MTEQKTSVIKITSNIDELHPLVDKLCNQIKEVKKTLDEINNFEVKVGSENITSN